MLKLEITIEETPSGIRSRTHAVKENMTELERHLGWAAETASACAMKNMVLQESGPPKLNTEGFLDDFGQMVVKMDDSGNR